MEIGVVATCLLIILARLGDVTLGTLRTIAIVNGRAAVAWVLGFFEVLIWLFAISHIFANLDQPIYALAYAFGFASGNYLGVQVERLLAFGEQVLRIFTRQGAELAAALRTDGYRVTEFDGRGRDGQVSLLFIEVKRRETMRLLKRIRQADPRSFCLVDDVRLVKAAVTETGESGGWRGMFKIK